MSVINNLPIIPVFTSRGDADAFLCYPYLFNRQGEWIGWVTAQREVYSVLGYHVGKLTSDPRIIRRRYAEPLPQAERSRHILVVEDDADVRRVIVECLGVIGYSVSEAANGTEGLEAIRRGKPDLLVVDYAMPDMSGAEVISKAREMVGDMPVILATGYADMAAVERLVGKPLVLRKPFDINSLGSAVALALQPERLVA